MFDKNNDKRCRNLPTHNDIPKIISHSGCHGPKTPSTTLCQGKLPKTQCLFESWFPVRPHCPKKVCYRHSPPKTLPRGTCKTHGILRLVTVRQKAQRPKTK